MNGEDDPGPSSHDVDLTLRHAHWPGALRHLLIDRLDLRRHSTSQRYGSHEVDEDADKGPEKSQVCRIREDYEDGSGSELISQFSDICDGSTSEAVGYGRDERVKSSHGVWPLA